MYKFILYLNLLFYIIKNLELFELIYRLYIKQKSKYKIY
jgi:hypothetical protein